MKSAIGVETVEQAGSQGPVTGTPAGMGPSASLLALLLCVFWGGVPPAIKLALEEMPPLAIAAYRFLIALPAVWAWCALRGVDRRLPQGARWPVIGFAAIFVVQISAINIGTQHTHSGYAALFLNTSPLFVAFLAPLIFPADRLTRKKLLGLLCAFLGVSLVLLPSGPQAELLYGNLVVLLSGFLLAVLHIFSKALVRSLHPARLILWEFIFGVPTLLLLSFVLEGIDYDFNGTVLGSLLYQGLVVGSFCFVTWTHLLSRYPASQVVSFQFTIPLFGVALSYIVLSEPVNVWLIVALPLVAGGILLVTSSPRS